MPNRHGAACTPLPGNTIYDNHSVVKWHCEVRGFASWWMLPHLGAPRKPVHARILLKADASPGGAGWDDVSISESLEVGTATIGRVRKQFVEEGLGAARSQPSHRQGGLEIPHHRRTDKAQTTLPVN